MKYPKKNMTYTEMKNYWKERIEKEYPVLSLQTQLHITMFGLKKEIKNKPRSTFNLKEEIK